MSGLIQIQRIVQVIIIKTRPCLFPDNGILVMNLLIIIKKYYYGMGESKSPNLGEVKGDYGINDTMARIFLFGGLPDGLPRGYSRQAFRIYFLRGFSRC